MNPNWPRESELIDKVIWYLKQQGYTVERDYLMKAIRVDIYAKKSNENNLKKIALECKSSRLELRREDVLPFALIARQLKRWKLITEAWLVSTAGFAEDAHFKRRLYDLKLVRLGELSSGYYGEAVHDPLGTEVTKTDEDAKKKLFALFPFNPPWFISEMFMKAIVPAAQANGFVAEYAKSMLYTPGHYLPMIQQKIEQADVAIVDTSLFNENVMYELGMCHALKEANTIVIACNQKYVPSNLAGFRFIFYDTQEDLKDKLTETLRQY